MAHGFFIGLALSAALQESGANAAAGDVAEAAEAIRVMRSYTHCTVGRHRSDVARFLALEPNSSEYQRFGMTLRDEYCLEEGNTLRFRWPLFRGGIFESLYRREFSRPAAAPFDDLPPLAYPAVSPGLNPTARARNIAILRFGECIVRGSPAAARALITSDVASPAEATAFRSLLTQLSACLPAGQNTSFSRPTLRGIVAEALYGLSVARRQAGPQRSPG